MLLNIEKAPIKNLILVEDIYFHPTTTITEMMTAVNEKKYVDHKYRNYLIYIDTLPYIVSGMASKMEDVYKMKIMQSKKFYFDEGDCIVVIRVENSLVVAKQIEINALHSKAEEHEKIGCAFAI